MKLFLKISVAVLVVLLIAWLVFCWFEADTEISILCSMFHTDMEREHVIHTLDTGDHLGYRSEAGPDGSILVDSLFNLRSTSCVIDFEDDRVVSATYQ